MAESTVPKATFIQSGDRIDYRPEADVDAGEVVWQKDLLGVALHPIKAGELGTLAITGVFEFPKKTGPGEDIATGRVLFWDELAKLPTKAPVPGPQLNGTMGFAVQAAGEDDPTVRVRLLL